MKSILNEMHHETDKNETGLLQQGKRGTEEATISILIIFDSFVTIFAFLYV